MHYSTHNCRQQSNSSTKFGTKINIFFFYKCEPFVKKNFKSSLVIQSLVTSMLTCSSCSKIDAVIKQLVKQLSGTEGTPQPPKAPETQ